MREDSFDEGALGSEGPEERHFIDAGLIGNESGGGAAEAVQGVDARCGFEDALTRDGSPVWCGHGPDNSGNGCVCKYLLASDPLARRPPDASRSAGGRYEGGGLVLLRSRLDLTATARGAAELGRGHATGAGARRVDGITVEVAVGRV